ncbi:SLC13 family permease [Calidifontibacillus erzurumensis]|uniref:Anion transporter n=1 Tax=Calidifontibacillus erzurumensis TaxID=2741433 RepID=A0A8J8GHC1_9BACI|nr:SLC13 family permease [Calidifontibacillus erzurumensis]NSL53201.1 anion transporter [Calidifontibacillus erzurumensis]
MKATVFIQAKKKIHINFRFLTKDKVFTISLLLAIASCFIQPPKIEYMNFPVLISLFNLMLAIKALDELHLLDKMAVSILNRCKNSQSVSAVLIFLCFFASMFVTNDVALLTFVPLTLVISKRTKLPMMETVILQTIAANIGSSFTPMGNPQNLFIYSHYGLDPVSFLLTVVSMAILGLIILYLVTRRLRKQEIKLTLSPIQIEDRKKATIWGLVLAITIASIYGMIPYYVAFIITMAIVFTLNKKLLIKIDYYLLLTFICFFIFVGNISETHVVQTMASASLTNENLVFFSSILLSQFISNVPASILLAEFTANWKPLLLGVNIGGLGTLIASMASVISYKLFISANPNESMKFLKTFSIYNLLFLAILASIQYFLSFGPVAKL